VKLKLTYVHCSGTPPPPLLPRSEDKYSKHGKHNKYSKTGEEYEKYEKYGDAPKHNKYGDRHNKYGDKHNKYAENKYEEDNKGKDAKQI
jgi:hypothetical protein